MGYSHITWTCPFFTWDEKLTIHCEAGVIRLPDKQTMKLHTNHYCANLPGWEKCSLAGAIIGYYDRKDHMA